MRMAEDQKAALRAFVARRNRTPNSNPRAFGDDVRRVGLAIDATPGTVLLGKDTFGRVYGWKAAAGYVVEARGFVGAGRTLRAAFEDAARFQGDVEAYEKEVAWVRSIDDPDSFFLKSAG